MMKMLIQLDERRVEEDGIYELADMWRIIDEKFSKACTKEIQPDGARMYSGIKGKNYFSCITLAYAKLKKQQWFAKYCIKWIWYDNEDDESLPLNPIDELARQRRLNPIFS